MAQQYPAHSLYYSSQQFPSASSPQRHMFNPQHQQQQEMAQQPYGSINYAHPQLVQVNYSDQVQWSGSGYNVGGGGGAVKRHRDWADQGRPEEHSKQVRIRMTQEQESAWGGAERGYSPDNVSSPTRLVHMRTPTQVPPVSCASTQELIPNDLNGNVHHASPEKNIDLAEDQHQALSNSKQGQENVNPVQQVPNSSHPPNTKAAVSPTAVQAQQTAKTETSSESKVIDVKRTIGSVSPMKATDVSVQTTKKERLLQSPPDAEVPPSCDDTESEASTNSLSPKSRSMDNVKPSWNNEGGNSPESCCDEDTLNTGDVKMAVKTKHGRICHTKVQRKYVKYAKLFTLEVIRASRTQFHKALTKMKEDKKIGESDIEEIKEFRRQQLNRKYADNTRGSQLNNQAKLLKELLKLKNELAEEKRKSERLDLEVQDLRQRLRAQPNGGDKEGISTNPQTTCSVIRLDNIV